MAEEAGLAVSSEAVFAPAADTDAQQQSNPLYWKKMQEHLTRIQTQHDPEAMQSSHTSDQTNKIASPPPASKRRGGGLISNHVEVGASSVVHKQIKQEQHVHTLFGMSKA